MITFYALHICNAQVFHSAISHCAPFTFCPTSRDSQWTTQFKFPFLLKEIWLQDQMYHRETFSQTFLWYISSRVTTWDAYRLPLCSRACNWGWTEPAPLCVPCPPFLVHLGRAASLWDQSGEAQPLPGAAGALPPEAATRGGFRRQRAHQEEPGEVLHTCWEDKGDWLQGKEEQQCLSVCSYSIFCHWTRQSQWLTAHLRWQLTILQMDKE